VTPSPPNKGTSRALALVALVLASLLAAGAVREDAGSGPSGPVRAASPPLTMVLQPDGANGSDSFILDATPLWNYGTKETLWVGRDIANGSLARSLLRFDLAGLPSNATVLDATLELSVVGSAGTVEARRASAPWVEGDGTRGWTRVPVTVTETAGVRRTLEPVEIVLSFPAGAIMDPARDLRIYAGGVEVPSQVSEYSYAGGFVVGAHIWFGATVPAWGTRAFDLVYSANGTATPAYRTRGFGPTALWTSPPVGSGASGVTAVDLNGDGTLEVVYGTQDGYVYALNATGNTHWATQLSAARSVPWSPQVADIDRDGRMDVIVYTNAPSLHRLDDGGLALWNVSIAVPDLGLSTPTLTDVDGDGVLDALLGGRDRQVRAFSGTNGTLIRSFGAGDWAYTASVADVDGDGRGEIFFGSDDSLVHAYAPDGNPIWANNTAGTSFIENSVAVGDVNGDGVLDIVTGDDGNSGPEFALDGVTGRVLWSRVLPVYREGDQTLADLDGDGTLEVLVGTFDGTLHALRGRDGVVLWTDPGSTSQVLAPAVVDVTNDGVPEILYLSEGGTTVRVLNATGAFVHSWNITASDPGFRQLSQQVMATPVVADLDGDGTMEVVVPTGSGVQAFATGGLARDWRTFGYNTNHTHRGGDGTSPDGVPFVAVMTGAPEPHPATGASWEYRDGVTRWTASGGDFGIAEASATAAAGWVAWNVTGMVADWHSGAFPNVGLFLSEADEAGGALHGFHSSDAANPALRPRLTITYTIPIVDPTPRIRSAIPNLVRAEDSPPWSLDLAGYAEDDDTPPNELRWNVTGLDPAIVQVAGENVPGNHVLTFYLQRDASGDMPVTYWLTDPQGNFAVRSAWVNVTPVNDGPTFSPPPTFVVRYNLTYTFDMDPYIADVDSPSSALVLTSDDSVHAAVSGHNVSFLYPDTYLGTWQFVGIGVSDGFLSTARVVAVRITADEPPVVTQPLPDLTLFEGELRPGVFDLDDYFTDPGNDALYFSYGYSHLNITIRANHSVDVEAQSNWFGIERVTFRGTDPEGALAEDTILVTVLPVNDPPTLGPVPDLVVHYDANYTFNLDPYIDDPDTALDGINASTSSPYVTVSGHLLTLRYPFSLNGTVQNLTIWIGDGANVASRTIRVTVSDDWPPVLQGKLADRDFLEDTVRPGAYDLSVIFDDPDGTPLFYSAGNVNVLVSIDASGLVDLSATRDWFGTERVTFRATDASGALAEDTVWIAVIPVDDAPWFRPIPTVYLSGSAGFLDLTPYLSDVDTNVTDLVLVASSRNATAVGQGLLFNYDGPTREVMEVVVSDGFLTNRTSVTVVVTAPRATEVIPGYLLWVALGGAAVALTGFVLYRRRQIEWVFLVTNGGLLISSVSRRDPTVLDTDLMMGMLTAIMDFAKNSFSDETERGLEELDLGDRRVEIERGKSGYLAIVYRGHVPGSLPRLMRSLLAYLETRYPDAFGDVVDPATLESIPAHLKRFVDRSWWPLLTFRDESV